MKISAVLKQIDEHITDEYVDASFKAFTDEFERYDRLYDYYVGKQDILDYEPEGRYSKNNPVVSNFAKYITTIANSHFISKEPSYSVNLPEGDEGDNKREIEAREDLEQKIIAWYRRRYVGHHDFQVGKHCSIYGKGYELLYYDNESDEDEAHQRIKTKALTPKEAFLIKDTSIEENVIAGLYVFTTVEDKYKVHLFTQDTAYVYEGEELGNDLEFVEQYAHDLGDIPIIEYKNNEECIGDFEQVISLIDAYNKMLTTRINDKEQFVDSILVATGFNMTDEDKDLLNESGIVNLPDAEAKLNFLYQALDETHSDILQKNIKTDIHRQSFVPDLSDEQFSGNSSGVALAYKLIGLEMLIKEKERNFEKGLRLRMKRLLYVIELTGGEFDIADINITFNRNLPTNIAETAEVIRLLNGIVSRKTLWKMLPDVKSTDMEEKEWLKDRLQDLEIEQKQFGQSNADMFDEEDQEMKEAQKNEFVNDEETD